MLDGNPLVDGGVPGKGFSQWIEGFAYLGIDGTAPIGGSASLYGGASVITSGSVGQGLSPTARASRPPLKAQVSDDNLRMDAFRVAPGELPAIDCRTIFDGVNLHARLPAGCKVGAAPLRVPCSDSAYCAPNGTFNRERLGVFGLRARWQPRPGNLAGPILSAEYALLDNRKLAMRAAGWMAEARYQFPASRWSPTAPYRDASFSGDDDSTDRFERWDPLLSGGNGERWVQGIHHFKVVQDSNLVSHRQQWRLRPSPKVELLPRAWIFRANSLTNISENPALTFLSPRDDGSELNLTAKYFASRHLHLHGHVAATFPGDAAVDAPGGADDTWWSFAFFARYAF
jgi:hypothetical protein